MGLGKGEQAGATWLLSGIPRSGSSLCCRLAGQLPNAVALSEPIDNALFHDTLDAGVAAERIFAFVAEARKRILEEGVAPSVLVAGRVDDQMVAAGRGGVPRQPQGQRGLLRVAKPLDSRFLLVVKHNALFAALLEQLIPRLPCLALVRNPVAVLASWETVDLPVQRGRVPAAERFAPALRDALDGEPDVLRRRVMVLDWFFSRYRDALPKERILRYEDVVQGGAEPLRRAMGVTATAPAAKLANQNANALYRDVAPAPLLSALLSAGGAWREFYTAEDCHAVANSLQSATVRAYSERT